MLLFHERVEQWNCRASAQTFYAEAVDLSFAATVFDVIGFRNVLLGKLKQIPVLLIPYAEVAVTAFTRIRLVPAVGIRAFDQQALA